MNPFNDQDKLEELLINSTVPVEEISNNVVVYTRVSTKEQAETNLSLDTQKSYVENFCEKSGYHIVAYFGGTYESAKTDGRKEFDQMLTFANKKTNKVSIIIVYSLDRFSRSGAHALYIIDLLQKN